MDIWFGSNAQLPYSQCAVTIGNFDGVHSGHHYILQTLRQKANTSKLTSVALIFEPQAAEFFAKQNGKNSPPRITPLRDKLTLLQQSACVDAVWVLRFTPSFAKQSANDFIQNILRKKLNTRYLLIGDDFRFGNNRSGDFDLLKQQNDFITEKTPSILINGKRASSTSVRSALLAGDLNQAQQILGHTYSLSGRVKHGEKRGRTIGVPTANIHLPPLNYALNGVFIVEVKGSFGCKRGVASFSNNPTVSHSQNQKLEVHIFDFSGNLYGERITVSFLHKLRDAIQFPNWESLKQQIWCDIQTAQNWQP